MFVTETSFKEKYVIRNNKSEPKKVTTLLTSVPAEPIYHYLFDLENDGPKPTDLMVYAITEVSESIAINIFHITNHTDERFIEHLGRKLPNDVKLVQDYHKRYRQFTRTYAIEKALIRATPLIINYHLLKDLYDNNKKLTDVVKFKAEFDPAKKKWLTKTYDMFYINHMANYQTMIDTAFSIGTERIQFLPINLPRILKPLDYYEKLIDKGTVTEINKINNRDDLILLDFFSYYSNDSNNEIKSVLDKYTVNKNIIFTIRDDVNVFYLSWNDLKEWRRDGSEKARLSWIYSIFEQLHEKRPVTVVNVDEVYANKVEEVKKEAKAEYDKGIDGSISDLDSSVIKHANKLLEGGVISESQYKGNLKLAQKYKTINNPYGHGTLIDFLNENVDINAIPKSKIPDMDVVVNKQSLNTKVKDLDSYYIENFLDRDVLKSIMQLQKIGIMITDVKSHIVEDVTGSSRVLSIQTKTIDGDVGTFKVEIPVINPNGTFKSGGVEYRMNKQRSELPIVKISPMEVCLTSAKSKMFVERGRLRANSYSQWLINNLLNLREANEITLQAGNVFDHNPNLKLPDTYSILAKKFRIIENKDFTLKLDYNKRAENLLNKNETKTIKQLESDGILVGSYKGKYLFINESNQFFIGSGKDLEIIGSVEDIFALDKSKIPTEYAEMRLKGKWIPVGVQVAYYKGIENFFNYIGVKVEALEPNQRYTGNGIVIRFKDAKIVLNIETKMQELLVGGFNFFKEYLKTINYTDLNKQSNWNMVFNSKGIGNSQIRDIKLNEDMWIDPTTYKLLVSMHEPTNIPDLYIRAVELLETQQHHHEMEGTLKIQKGYSRIADIVYRELMVGISELSRNTSTAKRKFSINPKAVKMAIVMDEGVAPSEWANPMKSVSSQERITYTGAGGRSGESMVGKHRTFMKSDTGVISECFSDSGKSGTVLYYTSNPAIENVYGKVAPVEGRKLDTATAFNNSMNLSPYLLKDDPKRTNFVRIHFDAWCNAKGQCVLPVRTGHELIIAHKAGDKFALVSSEKGKIISVSEKGMIIQYNSGTTKKYPLGRSFESDSGKVLPFNRITDRKVGYKFDVGEVLAWDSMFFERDIIEDKQVALYTGVPAIVATRETRYTYEDSSIQSRSYANKLTTTTTHIRDISGDFSDSVVFKVKVGDHVDTDTVLCYITPAGVELTEDATSLEFYSSAAPTAKFVGVIERIEWVYCGELSEANDSIAKLIKVGDKERKELAEFSGDYPTGQMLEPTHLSGSFVGRNTWLARIYITHDLPFANGDKYGLAHQLKTVSAGVWDTVYTTKGGLPIDVEFSYNGILKRIVESPVAMGIINMYIREIGLRACNVYDGKKPTDKVNVGL